MKRNRMFLGVICLVLALSTFFIERTSASPLDILLDQLDESTGVIAYIDSDGDIYLYIAETGARIQLTEDAEWVSYQKLQFSPGFDSLAYLRTNPDANASGLDLYIMDLASREATRVLENIGNYDWHPDGDKIVFGFLVSENCKSHDQESTNGIMMLNLLDGHVSELIPPKTAFMPVSMPEFSYDGEWLAFYSYPCFSSGFSTNVQNFSSGETFHLGIGASDWSPNSNHLLWAELVFGDMRSVLVEFTPDSDQFSEVFFAPEHSIYNPRLSPNGELIVMNISTKTDGFYYDMSDYPNWEDHLDLLDKDGRVLDRICEGDEPRDCFFESWSPDGRQILFTKLVDGQRSWALYTLATQSVKELSTGFGDGGANWNWNYGQIQWIKAIEDDLPIEATTEPEMVGTEREPEPKEPSLSHQNQPETKKISSITFFLILSGVCLVGVSIVIIVIVIVLAKRKNMNKIDRNKLDKD